MDPETLKNDKDFMSASPADQHAYLASQDKDYASAPPSDQQSYLRHVTGKAPQATMEQARNASVNTLTPEQSRSLQSAGGATQYGLTEFGKSMGNAAKGFGQMLDPRQKEGESFISSAPIARMGRGLWDLGKQATEVPGAIKDLAQSDDPLLHLGLQAPRVGGEAAAALIASEAPGAIAKSIGKVTAPIEANAATTEALHVPERSPLMQGQIRDVEAARPYIGGRTAEGKLPAQADIQARLPGAKQEAFSPINKALEMQKDRPVTFEGEQTNVQRLQNTRNELSAQRSRLTKGLSPEKLAELRATGEGKLVDLDSRIANVDKTLDPIIAETGVDPALVRKQYGALKGVERRVSGKSTVTEAEKPYGLRKLLPYKAPGALGKLDLSWNPIEGIRDIRAGKPMWSGKPTDVATGQLFKNAPTKPPVNMPVNPRITAPSRMLPRGPVMQGSAMEPVGIPSEAPPVGMATRAVRKGLILPEHAGMSRPIQIGSSMEGIGEPSGTPALLPYRPSLQQPPAFVRPMEIGQAPGTMELLPPEKFPAQNSLFDINVPRGASASRTGEVPSAYERALEKGVNEAEETPKPKHRSKVKK